MEYNRSHLLAQVQKSGYAGKPVEADVKAFLATKGIDVDVDGITVPGDEPNKEITLKWADVWGKTTAFALTAPEDEPVVGEPAEPETKKAEPKARPGAGWKAMGGGVRDTIATGGAPAIRSERERSIKAYNARVATKSELPIEKRPVFDSGEEAEEFTAFMRLATTGGGRLNYKMAKHDREVLRKAQVDFDNSLGGIAVPTYWDGKLIWLSEQYGVATKLANVQRMSSDKGVYPRRTSIAAMAPSAEAVAKGQVDQTFDGVTLNCREASNIYLASYQWYEDANVNVGDVIASAFAESAARRIDLDYFQGDGTSTYNNNVGLVGKLTGNRVASATNWAAQTTADHYNMVGLLEYVNSGRVRFAGSRQHFWRVCQRLQNAASQFTQLVGPAMNGGDRSYLDMPYHFAQVNWEVPNAAGLVPHTNSGTYNLFAGDFEGGSMIGIRDDIRINFSEHYKFAEGLLAWRGTMRYDINIHLSGRSSETYGPIVALKNS